MAELERLTVKLDADVAAYKTAMQSAIQQSQQLGSATQKRVQTTAQAQRAALDLAQAEARLAQQQGNVGKATQFLSAGLSVQTERTKQVVNAERQLDQVNQQASKGFRGLGSAIGGVSQMMGAMGLAFGAQQILQFGINAMGAANSLEKTEATVRALAGSQGRYNQVLELAKNGQKLYGGTLEENLRGLGSLVNLSNRSGAELSKLDNISRKLAAVDPVQGIEGANIALKEFLTGTGSEAALSLARRFELPKKAIADLAKEGMDAKERLAALTKVLELQGYTDEMLAASTNTTANSFTRASAAGSNLQIAIGSLLSQALAPAARGFTFLAEEAAKGIAELGKIPAKLEATEKATISGAKSYEDYRTRLAGVNMQLIQVGMYIEPLSQGQYALAKATDVATAAANAHANALSYEVQEQRRLLGASDETIKNMGKQINIGGPTGTIVKPGTPGNDAGVKKNPLTAALNVAKRNQAFELASTAGKISILQSEMMKLPKGSVDAVNKQTEIYRLQNQLRSEQERLGKRGITDATQRLNLEERTADSIDKQYKSMLDARLLALDDKKDRREEEKKRKLAERVLGSGTASESMREAARDMLERIPLEQAKRALEINSRAQEAGGQIINGKIFGHKPGDTLPTMPSMANVSVGGPAALQTAMATSSGGQGGMSINLLPDSIRVLIDGQQLHAVIEQNLRRGLDQGVAAGAGGLRNG